MHLRQESINRFGRTLHLIFPMPIRSSNFVFKDLSCEASLAGTNKTITDSLHTNSRFMLSCSVTLNSEVTSVTQVFDFQFCQSVTDLGHTSYPVPRSKKARGRLSLFQPGLLRSSKADVFSVQPILSRTDIAAANHRLASIKLTACNQAQSTAAWA